MISVLFIRLDQWGFQSAIIFAIMIGCDFGLWPLLLGITTLHNGMILSILIINSRDFALGFHKTPHTNGDVFLTCKFMIIP